MSFFMAVCLWAALLATPALAADTEIAVKAQSPPAVGETYTVTAEIFGNPGFSAVQFTLTYDTSVLECVSATTGAVLNGAMSATNPSASDGAIVAAASARELNGDGVLATFVFRVVGSGTPSFGFADYVLSDASGQDVAFTLTGAEKQETTTQTGTQTGSQTGTQTGTQTGDQTGTQTGTQTGDQTDPGVSLAPVDTVEHRFTDTADHWAESYINAAVDKGYFQGYADGSFRPSGKVTRGAFVTVLWRMAGRPQATTEPPFTDLGGVNAEFRGAIAWAYEQGYISGTSATTFAPGASVTRQAAMKILYLYAGSQSGQETLFTRIYDDTFTDSASLPSWAKAPMYWGIYNGLISGTSSTTLGGSREANRAQLAKILVNFAEKLGG